MSRLNQLIKNFFAYGTAELISKIAPFLCLPIITRLMPDTEAFGVFTLFTTITGIGVTLSLLCLNTAVFREYFEYNNKEKQYNVTRTALQIVFFTTLIFSLILIIFNKNLSLMFFNDSRYNTIVILSGVSVFFTTNNYLIELPTRLQNHRKILLLSKLLSSLVYYGVILYLIYLGYTYYSIVFASIFTGIILFVFFGIRNKDFFLKGNFNKDISKNLLKIGLPLLPASIMYWLYSMISTVIITHFLSLSDLGVFSIGLKVARIGNVFTAVLTASLTHFIYSRINDIDYKSIMGNLFEKTYLLTISFYIILYIFKDVIFNLFASGDYQKGIEVFPCLLLVPLLSFLKYFLLTQFIVIKKTIFQFFFLLFDCVFLFFLSYFLLQSKGILGVAIANVIVSFTSLVLVMVYVDYIKRLIILPKRTYLWLILFVAVVILI